MSETISFVASDELADRLDSEASDRMTTVSSTAQMLLAEHIQQCMGGNEGQSESQSSSDESKRREVFDSIEFLQKHAERNNWKEMPEDSNSGRYAVRIPEDSSVQNSGSWRYMDTLDGIINNLNRWHE